MQKHDPLLEQEFGGQQIPFCQVASYSADHACYTLGVDSETTITKIFGLVGGMLESASDRLEHVEPLAKVHFFKRFGISVHFVSFARPWLVGGLPTHILALNSGDWWFTYGNRRKDKQVMTAMRLMHDTLANS